MKRIVILVSVVLAIATTAAAQAPTDSTKAAPAAPAAPAASTSTNAVKRAVFCSGVAEHEPLDEITTLAAPADKVFFFTEVIGMEGKTVTHRWIHDGQTVSEVPISIGGARWRCYSTKSLTGNAAGSWSVEVLDDAGAKLGGASFTYTAAP
jgi:Protein of unknown function (DUF2914)